ncbi:hypothetical protein SuNHUV7_40040 (plasmid) [Pseudoseohaeicola sp. NH-UV-7]|uniref:hypothetical protein n=1 Tax=Sulfitobacter sp. TBRI5 TaxID=2989732 RepID=UPI003A6C586D
MPHDFTGFLAGPNGPDLTSRTTKLELRLTDFGLDHGIDVAIHTNRSAAPVFETVLADPESRVLLAPGSPETEIFWHCLGHCLTHDPQVLQLHARCCYSTMSITSSTRRMSRAEMRNARFLRFVEKVLDEVQTRQPQVKINISVTYRNPAFDRWVR